MRGQSKPIHERHGSFSNLLESFKRLIDTLLSVPVWGRPLIQDRSCDSDVRRGNNLCFVFLVN